MIAKPYIDPPPSSDRFRYAGDRAERQMAFYIHRAFAKNPSVQVLHNVCLKDADQSNPDGSPGICEIDCLILHRHGAFIVESKSVSDEVRIDSDGTGGDKWVRVYEGAEQGMLSPIQQARRQAEFLRAYLQPRRASVLGKQPIGLRTLTKLLRGTDQRGFRHMPLQVIVAISDHGKFTHVRDWKPPSEPFQVFVCKADNATEKVNTEIDRHGKDGRLLSSSTSQYGIWAMTDEEVGRVATFLAQHHHSRTPTSPTTEPPRK